jgi:hypothetical protein
MKLRSPSTAKLAILLSLAIATTSGLYASKTAKSVSVVKADVEKLVQDERSLQASSKRALQVLERTSAPPKLNTVLSTLLVDVMRLRLENGITVAAVNPGTHVPTAGASPVSAMTQKMEASTVVSTRVNVRGNYANYEGLLRYVEQLRTLPVAVVYFKVEGRQFELGLRAYGV